MNVLSLDLEHSYGIMRPYEEGFYITCCGLVTNNSEDVVWFDHSEMEPTKDGLGIIQNAINNSDFIVGHHLKHDMNILRYCGVSFENKQLWCTMVAEFLLRGHDLLNQHYSLNAVAEWYGFKPKLDKVQTYWDNDVDTYDIPAEILTPYVVHDCVLPLQIYQLQTILAQERGCLKSIKLQNEFQLSLSDMENNGFILNKERAEETVSFYINESTILEKEIKKIVGQPDLNLDSPSQLSAVLYGGTLKTTREEWVYRHFKTKPYTEYKLKDVEYEVEVQKIFEPLPRTKNKTDTYKTDNKTVRKLTATTPTQRKLKKSLIEYSNAATIIKALKGKKDSGLLNKIQPDGKVHAKFNQTVTRTGRLSSSEPNGQNLSPPIKRCIDPKNDGILAADLSQVEMRGAAELAPDLTMQHEINSGIDIHKANCENIMLMKHSKKTRIHSKVFGFRMIYGGTFWGFYLDADMPKFSKKKWQEIIKRYFKKYDGLKAAHDAWVEHVFEHGELQIKTGRWFKFHRVFERHGAPTYSENQIKNTPIQGIAGGDCLPLACVIIRRGMKKYNLKSKMILTVHDSLIFDYVKEELETLKNLCESVMNNLHTYMANYFEIDWSTKLAGEIEIGPNYGELNEI